MAVSKSHANQAIGYIRVSTDDQALSEDAQQHHIREWCRSHGKELVTIYTDLGISGAAPLEKRPGILAAIDALQPGMTLVSTKRDRLARDVANAATIERLVTRKHASVRTCDGVGDGSAPEDFMIKSIVDVFAGYERLIIAARTKTALAELKRQGKRVSRHPPYGFQFTPDNTLEPVAAEQIVITAARTYASGGLSLRKIAQRLATDGHLSRAGTTFTAKAINAMIREDAAA